MTNLETGAVALHGQLAETEYNPMESDVSRDALLKYSSQLSCVILTQARLAAAGNAPEDVARPVVEAAREISDAGAALIRFVDGDHLVCCAATEKAQYLLGNSIRMGAALSQSVVALNTAILCVDTESDRRVNVEVSRRHGTRSLISVPMRHDGVLVGVLRLYSPDPGHFNTLDLEIAQLLAGIAGSEIQRRRSQQAVRESETRFRSLTELSSDWYWEQDEYERFIEVSPAVQQGTGVPVAEIIGRTRWEVPGAVVDESEKRSLDATIAARQAFRDFNYSRVGIDGVTRHLQISGAPKFDDLGIYRGYRGVGKEISRQKRFEDALAASERFARMTLDALSGHICVLDESGRIIALNKAWREFALGNRIPHGQAGEGVNYLDVCARSSSAGCSDAETFAQGTSEVLAGRRELFFMEYPCHSPTEERWFQVRVTRFTDDGPVRAVVVHENITARKQAEMALHCSELRFRDLTEISADGFWEQDADYRFTAMGSITGRTGGKNAQSLLGKRRWDFPYINMTAADWERHIEALNARQEFRNLELCRPQPDGGQTWTSVSGRPIFNEAGTFTGYRGVGRNISRRKQAEAYRLRRATQQSLIASFGQEALSSVDFDFLNARAADCIGQGLAVELCAVMQCGPDGNSVILKAGHGWPHGWTGRSFNPTEWPVAQWSGTDAGPEMSPDCAQEPLQNLTFLSRHQIRNGMQVPIGGQCGTHGILGAYTREARRFTPEDGDFVRSIANIIETAIERKQAEDKLARMAQFDTLCGLPNRNLLHERLALTLSQSKRIGGLTGVLMVDLDRFKLINDTRGHAIGDLLLIQVAERLQECVRSGDTVARLGGDEFAVVLASLARPDDARLVARKIVDACARVFDLQGEAAHISASVGIALCPEDGIDSGVLLKNADVAMYRAKEQGRNGYQFYLPQMHERALARTQMEAQLHGALEREEFLLHFQPKADLRSGAVCGFEALLRWMHPVRGLVPPIEFISVLEETGLIVPVGEWVLRTACLQLKQWQDMGMKKQSIAVNISARQFQQEGLDLLIESVLTESGAMPQLLELELTESLLMDDAEEAVRVLKKLKALGVRLSVDDFGTGYSSLAYLKRFPLDTLKIDRTFIRDCIANPEDATIALAVINLAHSLKLNVVAEGVETEAQLAFLRSHGCDQIQGYYFARPMAGDAATQALRDGMCLQKSDEDEAHAPSILLVDDNGYDLELFGETFAMEGYRIFSAKSPECAFGIMAMHEIGIVISDQSMPEMSGVRFLAAIRQLYPETVRIMLTGSDVADTLPNAVNEAGIHRFISKHWHEDRLRQEVREAYAANIRGAT